jgi:hypothetical protein
MRAAKVKTFLFLQNILSNGSVQTNSTIFLFKKSRKAGNQMGRVYALDQPHLFFPFYYLPYHSCHQITQVVRN